MFPIYGAIDSARVTYLSHVHKQESTFALCLHQPHPFVGGAGLRRWHISGPLFAVDQWQ